MIHHLFHQRTWHAKIISWKQNFGMDILEMREEFYKTPTLWWINNMQLPTNRCVYYCFILFYFARMKTFNVPLQFYEFTLLYEFLFILRPCRLDRNSLPCVHSSRNLDPLGECSKPKLDFQGKLWEKQRWQHCYRLPRLCLRKLLCTPLH